MYLHGRKRDFGEFCRRNLCEEGAEAGGDVFDGKPDDVAQGFVVAFDDEFAAVLDAVRAGFVERVAAFEIAGDDFVVERLKRYVAGDEMRFAQARSRADEGDARENGVRVSAESEKYFPSFVEIGGFV